MWWRLACRGWGGCGIRWWMSRANPRQRWRSPNRPPRFFHDTIGSPFLPVPPDQLYVYVIPAQTATGIYPPGGDVRHLISGDGGAIVKKRQLHESIMENNPSSVPKDSTPAGG